MKHKFTTTNTCSKEIRFELNDNIVTNVEFLGGGCSGNLQALPKLVDGMTVDEIKKKIGGIICGRRGTSCADQLATAVSETYEKQEKVNI